MFSDDNGGYGVEKGVDRGERDVEDEVKK